ncbi:MAG: flippase activity-associated protein Agl23 [Actinomycetota bacterium]
MTDPPDLPPTESGSAWRTPRTGVIVLVLVAIALALRLWELGARAMHHDESLDAWWSWLFRNGGYERYDPVYHGPLRFYITAGFYEVFGESEATARLFSALSGTAAVGLPWFLRRELGRVGTIAAAVALTISPTMLYYSRFGREDAQMVFLALLALVLGLSYLRRPRTATAAGLAFTLACSFAIKESTYLFGLLLAVYLLIVLAAQFESQARTPSSPASGQADSPFNASFFASTLAFASIGLTVAVVIGSAADELFPMLALYMAALGLFTVATAMPRLRAAGIEWSHARAATVLVGAAVVGQIVRSYGEEPGPWSASTIALAIGVLAMLFAVGSASGAVLSDRHDAAQWALAFGLGGAALIAVQWVERRVAQGPAIDAWSVSPAALGLGAIVMIAGLAVWRSEQLPIKLPPFADTPLARLIGGLAALGGGALMLNEYTESESNRAIAALVIGLVLFGIVAAVRALPTTTGVGFQWPALLRSFGAIGWTGWLVTMGVFAVSWYLFFTVWGSVKEDWASGFTRAIDYWDSQQEVNRGGQPWYYYLFALPAYEWFFVALAGVGGWRALRRPTILSGIFVWFAIGSLILYSYAGERMPWLIAHPLLPILILAGFGVQQLWQHRDHRAMPTIALVCLLGLVATTGTAWRASFPNGADSREILSQAGQATPHLVAALDRLDNIDRLSRQATGEPATLAIGTANAWPYNWYLRDRANILWFNNCGADDEPGTCGPPQDDTVDVIIVDYAEINTLDYPDFEPTLFAMRSWWVPTYTEAGPLGWLGWVRGLELWEQQPNSSFSPLNEVVPPPVDGGLSETLDRLRDGIDAQSSSFRGFSVADGDVVSRSAPISELDDGRDGCGSVDQWFLVRREWAATERQVYPGPIGEMGPLECASDLVASG